MPAETVPGLFQQTPLTVKMIFERMRSIYPDGEVVDAEGRSTYGALAERILKLCTALRELGVKPGDRVGSFGFNSRRHFELYYAVPLLGAVLHTINIRLYDEQISYIVNHAEDKIVFVDGELTERLSTVAGDCTTVEKWVRMGDGPDAGLSPLLDHDELVAGAPPLSALPEFDENAAMGICYTSGTTGNPKGVLYSHRGTVLHAFATSMADHVALSNLDRILLIVPMFHAFGWSFPYSAPFTGAELIFPGADHTPENLHRLLVEEKATKAGGVPTIWKEVLPLAQKTVPPKLDQLMCGGSAPPHVLIKGWDELGVNMLQIWGMTETAPLACVSRPRRHHMHLGHDEQLEVRTKTGTIFAGLEARIVDDADQPMTWDGKTAGELEVRGPWVASDYYNDPTSAEKFHDGWLRTGDMAIMEPEGYFQIVDRAKDLIKSGGEWISSVELEGVILAHPKVLDSAVVGVTSAKWDERPVALVIPQPGQEPTLDEINEFLADKVAKWWLPDALVLVDDIPKTSVGKIDKKVIRDQLNMELP